MTGIEVRNVRTPKERRSFVRFPWTVYRGDPNGVPPLIADMKDRLDPRKHPFIEHGEAERFLAYLLYAELEKAVVRKGRHWRELSWRLEDNQAINRFAASIGAAPYRKYRIYEKSISPQGGERP
jgi:hypothetical protein